MGVKNTGRTRQPPTYYTQYLSTHTPLPRGPPTTLLPTYTTLLSTILFQVSGAAMRTHGGTGGKERSHCFAPQARPQALTATCAAQVDRIRATRTRGGVGRRERAGRPASAIANAARTATRTGGGDAPAPQSHPGKSVRARALHCLTTNTRLYSPRINTRSYLWLDLHLTSLLAASSSARASLAKITSRPHNHQEHLSYRSSPAALPP